MKVFPSPPHPAHHLPMGLKVSSYNLVCKLNQSIYGLKQSSRQWNHKLTTSLIELGYNQSRDDYSLFTKNFHNSFTVVLVYVDDLMIVGDNLIDISYLK